MGKLDELMRTRGGNAAESMGAGVERAPLAGQPGLAVPARLQGVSKSKNAVEIPVDRIDRDPGQPREEFDFESLGRLADSMKARGQLQPIRVRWDEDRSLYVVVVGERRWRAAKMAGLATLSAVVMDGPLEPGELLAIQLVENAVREDLKPIEQAKAFKALMDRKQWTVREVAKELSIAHANVVRAVALLKLPQPLQDSVESGEIAPATAYELSKIDDPAEQADLAGRAAAGQLKRDQVAERTRRSPGRKPRAWTWETDRVKVSVSPLAEDVSDEELTEALKSALAERRKRRGRAA